MSKQNIELKDALALMNTFQGDGASTIKCVRVDYDDGASAEFSVGSDGRISFVRRPGLDDWTNSLEKFKIKELAR